MNRRLIVRAAAILLVLLLAICMYLIGRQHTILVDNKSVEGGPKALQEIEVAIDKQDSMELYPRDRDQYIVTGQSHTLHVKYTDSNWNEIDKVIKFKVPARNDMYIISLPKLAQNPDAPQSEWLEVFISMAVQSDAGSEEPVVSEDPSAIL
ncbi:MAG: hypothetical protein IJ831_06910 [Spirochaetales bacterium]|nr:hypothetical protein [Spirochaetales bacterium]